LLAVNQIDNYLNSYRKRIQVDLLERSIPGIILYALVWPMIFLPVGLDKTMPLITWGISALLITLSLFRFAHKKASDNHLFQSHRTWVGLFAISSISQATVIGLLFAFSMVNEQMDSVRILLVFVVCGFASGAINSLNCKQWLAASSVSMLLAPAAIVCIVLSQNYPLALLITLYLLYLILLGRKGHDEYTRAFKIEYQLEEQRLELEQINKIDPLTQIYNRGHFNTNFEFQWNASLRNKEEISLLLIDIDHFKSINDDYGHLFGDEALIVIAKTINDSIRRRTDLVARYGGEEFVILLPQTPLKDACTLADRIRQKIQNRTFEYKDKEISITASIGAGSMIPQENIDPEKLINMADKALYQAKDQGRNRVCSSSKELRL